MHIWFNFINFYQKGINNMIDKLYPTNKAIKMTLEEIFMLPRHETTDLDGTIWIQAGKINVFTTMIIKRALGEGVIAFFGGDAHRYTDRQGTYNFEEILNLIPNATNHRILTRETQGNNGAWGLAEINANKGEWQEYQHPLHRGLIRNLDIYDSVILPLDTEVLFDVGLPRWKY